MTRLDHSSDATAFRLGQFTALITALMAVGTVAQFALGALGPLLVADFGLSRTQFGALTTTLFAIAALLSPATGHAIDRTPARTAYSVAFLVSVVTLGGLALAPTFLWLLVFAGSGGVGQALVNPLSNKLVAEHIPAGRQGLVMGVKQSGVQVGAVVAGFSLPWLAALLGWRTAMAGTAAVILLAWLITAGRVPAQPLSTGEDAPTSGRVPAAVFALAGYAFLMGSAVAAVSTYLPLYAHDVLGLSAAVAGTLVGAIGLVGMGSRVALGHLIDRVGNVTLLLNLLATIATTALVLVVLADAGAPALVWPGALLFGGSVGWNAVAMIAVVREVGRASTGKASGYVMVGFFAGFIVTPLAFGAAVDVAGYTIPWLVMTACLLATSLGVWVWRRRRAARRPA